MLIVHKAMITKKKWFTENACKETLLKINIAFLQFKPAIHVYNCVIKENPRTDKLQGIFHFNPMWGKWKLTMARILTWP